MLLKPSSGFLTRAVVYCKEIIDYRIEVSSPLLYQIDLTKISIDADIADPWYYILLYVTFCPRREFVLE